MDVRDHYEERGAMETDDVGLLALLVGRGCRRA